MVTCIDMRRAEVRSAVLDGREICPTTKRAVERCRIREAELVSDALQRQRGVAQQGAGGLVQRRLC
jgi:hypothetical protein